MPSAAKGSCHTGSPIVAIVILQTLVLSDHRYRPHLISPSNLPHKIQNFNVDVEERMT